MGGGGGGGEAFAHPPLELNLHTLGGSKIPTFLVVVFAASGGCLPLSGPPHCYLLRCAGQGGGDALLGRGHGGPRLCHGGVGR